MLRTKCTGAPLPWAREDSRDRRLEALVVVRDAEANATQTARAQATQELDPEGLGLDLAQVDPDHLPAPALMHGIRDDQCL